MRVPAPHPPGVTLRHAPPVPAAVPVTIRPVALQIQLLGQRVHLLEGLSLFFFCKLLYCKKSILPQLDSLGSVANTRILDQSTEHHKKADTKVNVYRLHIGNFWQGSVDAGHEGGHGEHGGYAQANLGDKNDEQILIVIVQDLWHVSNLKTTGLNYV